MCQRTIRELIYDWQQNVRLCQGIPIPIVFEPI